MHQMRISTNYVSSVMLKPNMKGSLYIPFIVLSLSCCNACYFPTFTFYIKDAGQSVFSLLDSVYQVQWLLTIKTTTKQHHCKVRNVYNTPALQYSCTVIGLGQMNWSVVTLGFIEYDISHMWTTFITVIFTYSAIVVDVRMQDEDVFLFKPPILESFLISLHVCCLP